MRETEVICRIHQAKMLMRAREPVSKGSSWRLARTSHEQRVDRRFSELSVPCSCSRNTLSVLAHTEAWVSSSPVAGLTC